MSAYLHKRSTQRTSFIHQNVAGRQTLFPLPSSRASPASSATSILPTCSVDAAALQDHFAKNLNLSLAFVADPFRRNRNRSKPSTQAGLCISPRSRIARAATETLTSDINAKSSNARKAICPSQKHHAYRLVWTCDVCTLENEDGASICVACNSTKPRQHHRVSDTLSLAQKRGLIAGPPPKLSAEQWKACEECAETRGDTSSPCSICRESFGMQAQVILSCSHTFHRDCLASFERFLRTNQRTCPLCRKQDYQKKLTTQGARAHRQACIVSIQAFVRGSLARRKFHQALTDHYKSGRGDTNRRKTFYANKISSLSSRIAKQMAVKADAIDSLLEEFDRSIALSQRVFSGEGGNDDNARNHDNLMTADKWTLALEKAKQRGDEECPICINPLGLSRNDIVLLSCSHVLHTNCIRAFEEFNIYEIHLCPVCRANYESRSIHELGNQATY